MKRTIKTLGVFLSAFFLLTGCSSDDEDIDLSNIETNELLIQSDKGKSSIGLAYEPHSLTALQIDNFKFDALDKECVYTIDGTIVYKLPQD